MFGTNNLRMEGMTKRDVQTDSEKLQQNNPLTRKLNKLLETRLENDKETLDALKALSTFFTENNLRTRRSLRSDIERQSLSVNEEFVSSLREVKEALDLLHDDVMSMNNCCQDMTEKLKATKLQTHDLILQTTKLQTDGQKIQMKQEVVNAFLDTFQLKPEEVKALKGTRDGNLDENFFKVLSKVKKIHGDCKVLLRCSHQTAGIEIMESMAMLQETAYERLYRWTQGELRSRSTHSPDITTLLHTAMGCLQDRPVLFKYCLDEYSTARRAAIVHSFIDALTRGGPRGNPRPIEQNSHDPLRYVSDMLAWLHQNVALEKEMLESLLRDCKKDGLHDDMQQVLSHITEGLCRPLKMRVEQVVVSEPGSVILFRLASLLRFYHDTIKQVLTADSQLPQILDELKTLALQMFYNSLNCHCNQLLERVELPPANLGATEALSQTLSLLREILSCQDACLVSLEDRQQNIPQILTTVVDPLLHMCHVSASKLSTVDMAVYLINCIYLIHSSLALFEFTDSKLESLQAQMDAHTDTLVSEQASFIVGCLGMGAMYHTLQEHQPSDGPLSAVAGCDALAVQAAVNKLESFLNSTDMLIIPQCNLLLSGTLRQTVRRRSMELLSSVYQQMYDSVHNPASGYPDPATLMPRTPDQVKMLLRVGQ